ncbi:hypothetical protein SAMN05660380_00518 [Xylella fastidiosa]|jgi:hypothetical protein|nr:hypothetical protein XFEB_01626 [Xylella fastidiosa EB92.1]SHG37502.1 hypothetical protein SAMN05660380_00518 [Xylella fastidiosa]
MRISRCCLTSYVLQNALFGFLPIPCWDVSGSSYLCFICFNGLLTGASALCRQLITRPGDGQVWVANLSLRSQSWSRACCEVGRTCVKQRDALLLIRAFAGIGTGMTVWNCCHAAALLGTLQRWLVTT